MFAVHKPLADGRGFEPLDRVSPVDGLANRCIKPTLPTIHIRLLCKVSESCRTDFILTFVLMLDFLLKRI